MDELVKAFHKFLMRDLSYITGGSAVILSFLYIFNLYPNESAPTYLYVFGVAIAYVVGYAIQDALGLLHIIRMKAGHRVNCLGCLMYMLYDRKAPETFDDAEYKSGKNWLYTSSTAPRYKDDHERIEGLKQVGFTVGPCLIISAILLGIQRPCVIKNDTFYHDLRIALWAIGVVLYLLGWLKVTQQTQYVLLFGKKRLKETLGLRKKRRIKETKLAEFLAACSEVFRAGPCYKAIMAVYKMLKPLKKGIQPANKRMQQRPKSRR